MSNVDFGLRTLNLPKHLLRFVCLSMNTLELITFPNGMKAWSRSISVNSCGRWYINRLAPSGPSVCFPAGESAASAVVPAGAYACGKEAGKKKPNGSVMQGASTKKN